MHENLSKEELIEKLREVTLKLEKLKDVAYREQERNKELHCLYGISKIFKKVNITLEEIIQETVDFIPCGWQYPEITYAQAIIEDKAFQSENYKETLWKQSSKIVISGLEIGFLEIGYLEKKPNMDIGPFLKEEQDLIDAIAEELGRALELYESQRRINSALNEKDYLLNQVKNNLEGISRSIVSSKSSLDTPISLNLNDNGKSDIEKLVEFIEVLANKDRFKIFDYLRTVALNMNDIKDLIEKSQSTTSHHIQIFRKIGIIIGWKRGKYTYYSVNQKKMTEFEHLWTKWLVSLPFTLNETKLTNNQTGTQEDTNTLIQNLSALGNLDRFSILDHFKSQEHNVTSLEKILEKSQSSIHHHIKILKDHNFITGYISGKYTNYKIVKKTFQNLNDIIYNWFNGITNWLRRTSTQFRY
jgi:DNA-binding transcriptional ArsR family regulator